MKIKYLSVGNLNKAIIATRFSNAKQIGNTSTRVQVNTCTEYCSKNVLEIVETKTWEAETADKGNLKRILELIEFCKKNKNRADTLVVFKIDRFARDIAEHYYLKTEIEKLGFKIRSATEPIDGTPTGELMEGILATIAQFDNAVRKQRVKLAMENLLEKGIYPWQAPTGYINKKDRNGRASVAIIDESCFDSIKSVFEKFSTGNYTINSLSGGFKNKKIYNFRGKRIRFYPQFIQKVLSTKYYCGILEAPEWCRQTEYDGKHTQMVSAEIFSRCQDIMYNGNLKGIGHHNENDCFPVRDRLYCGICGKKMTAAWCGHKENKVPLYYCHNPKCTIAKKSVSKKDLETEFITFLKGLKIKDKCLKQLEEKLMSKYEKRKGDFENESAKTRKHLDLLEIKKTKIKNLIENETYDRDEGKQSLDKIKDEINKAKLKLTNSIGEEFKIEYLIEHGKRILLTLKDLWESADYPIKLKIQRKFFPDKIIYTFPGFSNTKLSPILDSLEEIESNNSILLPRMDSNHNKQLQRLLSYH